MFELFICQKYIGGVDQAWKYVQVVSNAEDAKKWMNEDVDNRAFFGMVLSEMSHGRIVLMDAASGRYNFKGKKSSWVDMGTPMYVDNMLEEVGSKVEV